MLAGPGPRVFGATPLDPWLNIVHPCQGASFLTLHNELSAFYELKCVTLARSDRGDAIAKKEVPLCGDLLSDESDKSDKSDEP